MWKYRNSIVIMFFAVAAAACSSGGGTTFTAAPTPSPPNISGDYSGTWSDTQGGAGNASGTLAQHGPNAGGAVTIVQTSGTVVAQMAITVAPTNTTSGSLVMNLPSGTCTFSTTGTYTNNGTTAVLSGTYNAVTNCTGDSGSFTLSQQCTDTVTANARRSMVFPKPC